ncbi:MAG: UDP-glucose--hexose-1-phosphate uridylyltransferase [Clostridia bacterium]|nr:UDP-glucose--hexose-1-phosphate uridylyltransferase [Clostridia bacterium]
MIDGKILIEKLLLYARTFLGLAELDVIYLRNTLLTEFNLSAPIKNAKNISYVTELDVPDELINEIIAYALENKIASSELDAELFANYVMGLLSPRPSEVNRTFNSLLENVDEQEACNYLYNLSTKNYYIRQTAISKNVKWVADELKIPLDITINLSKPEKNNKDIAKVLTAKHTNKYPECALCKENEGFYGHATQPARSNLRTVKTVLGDETWYMQYSPYLYFNEHCILFNSAHVPMKIDGDTVQKLFDFIEMFPNYFIGSNADLPIVGGSILNHEHYQGGKFEMPLHKTKAFRTYKSKKYTDVSVEVLDFYNSVIRICGFNRDSVQSLATDIIEAWKGYSDETVGIVANVDGVRHNTVTPIVRFLEGKKYCIELILRNNSISSEYPEGVFHAHPEYHNIKKEGIGLIEAMGLFVLPARLERQFGEISKILSKQIPYDETVCAEGSDLFVHKNMIEKLLNKYPNIKDESKANLVIREYVNKVCAEILINTAVFKRDKHGISAFNKFLASVEIK